MHIDLVILAGGRSSRMGEDKLLLRREERLLIDVWIERIAWPLPPLLVLPPNAVAPTELRGVCVANDAVADEGPLRGVQSAFDHRQSDWQLIVPIDMPNLRRVHLDWFAALPATDTSARLWMSQRTIGNHCAIEPFPLLIHPDLAPTVAARLAEGRRSLHKLADEPQARVVNSPADWDAVTWLNLNRPDDLAAFLSKPPVP